MAAYTRCLRCAGAPRRPARGSGLSLLIPSRHAVLYDPGELDIDIFQKSDADMAFAEIGAARHSQNSRNPLHAGHAYEASLVRIRYGLSGCSPPCTDQTGFPASGGFYFRASNETNPVAGYDYNSDWTLLLAGLSPAGMAASRPLQSI